MLHTKKEAAPGDRERDLKLEEKVNAAMRQFADPTSRLRREDSPRLPYVALYHVSEPDHRGLRYVLYTNTAGAPMTAWITEKQPFELVSVEDSW